MLVGTKGEAGGHWHEPWPQVSLDSSNMDVEAKERGRYTYNCTQLYSREGTAGRAGGKVGVIL